MSLYAVSANGKESWKMTEDPRQNAGPLQKLIDLFTAHRHSSLKTSLKSFNNFLRYFAHKQTNTHTQTDTEHNLLGAGWP